MRGSDRLREVWVSFSSPSCGLFCDPLRIYGRVRASPALTVLIDSYPNSV